jgi:hypothetical protein
MIGRSYQPDAGELHVAIASTAIQVTAGGNDNWSEVRNDGFASQAVMLADGKSRPLRPRTLAGA